MDPIKTTPPVYKRLNKSERRHIRTQKGLIRRTVADSTEQKRRIAALYPAPKVATAPKAAAKPAK